MPFSSSRKSGSKPNKSSGDEPVKKSAKQDDKKDKRRDESSSSDDVSSVEAATPRAMAVDSSTPSSGPEVSNVRIF